MSYSDHPHTMLMSERHLIGVDHTPNASHGNAIFSATATCKEFYTDQPVPQALLGSVTIAGLIANVLIGNFPQPGKYYVDISCVIGSETFDDRIIILVQK